MRKFFIVFSILAIFIAGIGYVGYNYAISYASTKVIDHVVMDLVNENVMDQLLSDPNIRKIVEELEMNDFSSLDKLPIKSKEEGLKTVLNRFSIDEIKDIAVMATDSGFSEKDQVQLLMIIEDRLTEEEIQALKIIGLAELKKELLKK